MKTWGGLILAMGICMVAASEAQTTPDTERGKAVIVGQVRDEHGNPMAGIPVFAQTDLLSVLPESYRKAHSIHGGNGFIVNGYIPEEYMRMETAHAVTGADGTYRITGVTTASYTIMLDYKEKQPRDWTAIAIKNISAKENQTVAAPDLVLLHGALITGSVRDYRTHKPISTAEIEYMGPAHPNTSGPFSAANTQPDGTYSLRLAPGANTVFIASISEHWSRPEPKGFWISVDRAKPHFYPGLSEAAAVKIAVHNGETHDISFDVATAQ